MSITTNIEVWYTKLQQRQRAERDCGRIDFSFNEIVDMVENLKYKPTGYMLMPEAILVSPESPRLEPPYGEAPKFGSRDRILHADRFEFDSLEKFKAFSPEGFFYLYDLSVYVCRSPISFAKEHKGLIRYAEVPFELVPKD